MDYQQAYKVAEKINTFFGLGFDGRKMSQLSQIIINNAAQQSFAADVATCSCPTFIPCHIEGKLVCADCKKPQRR